jgi:hypothetical protein
LPRSPETAQSFQREVSYGVALEEGILNRWATVSELGRRARGFLRAGEYDDFDFVVFGTDGLVIAYVEVKRRRVRLADYGDALFPARKHAFALRATRDHAIPVLGVVEYACGNLVVVDLAQKPAQRRDIARRDRPGQAPIPHVLYAREQMEVVDGPER